MEEIIFDAGDRKRFDEFVKNISNKDRIGLISHVADPDGIVSARVVGSCINPAYFRFADYREMNGDLVRELKEQRLNKLILTDLMPEDPNFVKEVGKNFDVLWIDHRPFKEDPNSDKFVFMNAQGYCAAYLSYNLFSGTKNIESLDWLVAAASITDFMIDKNADWLDKTFNKYGEKFARGNVKLENQGKFGEIGNDLSLAIIALRPDVKIIYDNLGEQFGDLGNLRNHIAPVKKDISDCIERYETDKLEFNDGYFFEFESKYPIKSYVSTKISVKVQDKSLIIAQKKDGVYTVSARRQDRKINMIELMQNLIQGFENSKAGGHPKATGGHFPEKYIEEFKKRLQSL